MTEIKFHESAEKHVSGEAVYVDDIVVSEQLLYGKVVYSPDARARIKAIYLDDYVTDPDHPDSILLPLRRRG